MKKLEARNPQYKAYTELMISRNKFMQWMGFEITKIEPGYLEGELEFKEMHHQQNGWLHGGVTSTILDMIQGFASYSMVEEGQKVFTVEAKISYFNPGIADKFYSRGGVVKPGKRFHFCEAEIYYIKEGEEVTVAKGSATMAVIDKGN
ncbi:MAG TPA: PaaI family thioesterase [Chitinophagales bacterium]|nr:PaaI family thioesterase [Chitinophagales bacterium]